MSLDLWEKNNPQFLDIIQCWKKSTGCSIDSRTIQPGELFFALKGTNVDGSKFAEKALESGASGAVVSQDSLFWKKNPRIFEVDDPLTALQCLARWHRLKYPCTVLGLTGSNGKTTTKEILSRIFPDKNTVWATPGNFNNHIGLPLTLLKLRPQHRIAILEMGDNHTGDIALLCEIALPDYGLITNIGKDHIGFLGTLQANAASKAELITALEQKKTFFLNLDDSLIKPFCDETPVITYSTNPKLKPEADFYGSLTANNQLGIQVVIEHQQKQWKFNTHLPGAYNLSNILAAVAVGITLGTTPESIQHGLNDYIPQNNRSQWITFQQKQVLLDAYNANPSSMEVAISNFCSYAQPNNHSEPILAFILGDMLELGEYSVSEHQALADLLQDVPKNSIIILVGQEIKVTSSALTRKHYWFESINQAIPEIQERIAPADLVLVKGSRGIGLEKIFS